MSGTNTQEAQPLAPIGGGMLGGTGQNTQVPGEYGSGPQIDLSPDEAAEVVLDAKYQFEKDIAWEGTFRGRFIDDIKFAEADAYNMYQWPNAIRRSRDVDERPCLTINKTRQHNLQIINDAKQNKPGVKVLPVGNGATVESAKVFMGVIRRIESQSNAGAIYDQATSFQVRGGYGVIRIATDYAGDDTFDQEIFIRPVFDPLSVLFDRDAKFPDKSDGKHAFIFDNVARRDFKKIYPEYADLIPSSTIGVSSDDWISEDQVRICEYFYKKAKEKRLMRFTDPATGQERQELSDSIPDELLNQIVDSPSTKYRTVVWNEVHWVVIVGDKMAEHKVWPGTLIPLVPVIGEETVVDGIMDRKGHTRALIDPQRIYNYWAHLSLSTPIPTPYGWSTVEALKVGDLVLDEKGQPATVLGKSPVYTDKPCYEITFDDNSTIQTSAEHKWTVEERGKAIAGGWEWLNKTITTEELVPKKHFIWRTQPLQLQALNLPIDPYILGVWLGDGTSAENKITVGYADLPEMLDILRASIYDIGEPHFKSDMSAASITIFGIRESLTALGVRNNKHIPNIYLRGSYEQRLALLQGLMDTDGHFAEATHTCGFTTKSIQLAKDFAELLCSLGIRAKSCLRPAKTKIFPNGEIYTSSPHIQFDFTTDPTVALFRLPRKAKAQTRPRVCHKRRTKRHGIKAIRQIPAIPVQCIGVDSESNLFLAGRSMVPTHNSAAVEFGVLQTKTPWIAPAAAIEGHEPYWNNANKQNLSVLPWNHVDDDGNPVPPPSKTPPPEQANLYLQGMAQTQTEMMLVSGQYQAMMGAPSNERSGKAIQEKQRQGDNATYHYIDNLGISIRLLGKILMELIPKVYDAPRVMHILAEDNAPVEVQFDPGAAQAYQQQLNADQQVVQRIFNPMVGKYEVQADLGPAYATRREETFNAMVQVLTQAPELTGIIGDYLFKNAPFPEADEIAARLKRMVPPQALGTGPSASEQALQQQVQQLNQLLSKTFNELVTERLKLKGKDQLRDVDVYKAETDRMKAIGGLIPEELLKPLVAQLVNEALQTHLGPVLQSAMAGMFGSAQQPMEGAAFSGLGQGAGPTPNSAGAPGLPPMMLNVTPGGQSHG